MTVLLLYIGAFGIIVSYVCQLIDENDRFFTPKITEIPWEELGIAIGVGCIGKKQVFLNWISLTYFPTRVVWILLHNEVFEYDSSIHCGNFEDFTDFCGIYCSGMKVL